ncbi:kinetochore component CENP-S [Thamnidium elegans]|nr:kinetochore component CENP-S [Thamnidium elegans]
MDNSQKLMAAVWQSVRTIVEEEANKLGKEVSPTFTSSLAEVVYSQMGIMATDLEAFASHGKRAGISMEDVKLCARRNDSLHELLREAAKELKK